jgi:hypothetical protein
MTISDLKRELDKVLSKAVILPGGKGLFLNVTRGHWTIGKYACTTEEKDFTFISGKVYYKGIELKAI